MVGGILGAGASLIGSYMDYKGQKEANTQNMAFASSEAQKNRDFQQYNADTPYQRQVEDLSKAGLNPALGIAGGGGASSVPSGSQAQTKVSNTMSSAKEASRAMTEQMRQVRSQISLQDAQTKKELENAQLYNSSAQKAKAETDLLRQTEIMNMPKVSDAKRDMPFKDGKTGAVQSYIRNWGPIGNSIFNAVKGVGSIITKKGKK